MLQKEEDFNCDDINNELEEKLFYINPIKNKLNKKEINFNQRNTSNKIQGKKISKLHMKLKIIV